MNRPTPSSTSFNRRTFLQIVATTGAVGACWKLGLLGGANKLQVVRRSQPIMGTYLNLTLYGDDRDQCEQAIRQTIERMVALEQKLSRHVTTSEVGSLNSTGVLNSPSAPLLDILDLSRTLSEKSDGGFDITVMPLLAMHQATQGTNSHNDQLVANTRRKTDYTKLQWNSQQVNFTEPDMAITLDGIAKGYVVDQGIAALKQNGFTNLFVDAGGDLMVTGAKDDGSPWKIGIHKPRKESSDKQVVISASNKAIATSGDYFQAFSPDLRHHHIIDPRTGFSSPELASCTVTAPTVALADGLATAVMALGQENGLELLESMEGCEGYLIDKQLTPSHSTGFFS